MSHVWVPVKVVKTTASAVLVDDERGHQVWLPRSQINDWTTDHGQNLNDEAEGKDIELEVAEWIAIKEGLV